MASSRKQSSRPPNGPNFWGFLQNIIVAGMNKGQLIVLLLGTIILVLVFKLRHDESAEILRRIVDELAHYHLLGWIISVITTLGWFFNTKKMRKRYSEENKRIGQEKSLWQEKALGKKLLSSDDKKKYKK